MKVLYTDHYYADVELERGMFEQAGIEFVEAQSETEADVIAAAQDISALILHFAPMTGTVFEALPNLKLISVAGVGVDQVDLVAAAEHGIWVSNVPDGNYTEVGAHALALALALVRQLPAFDRNLGAGEFDYLAGGELLRPGDVSVGIVGLGRIGQEFYRVAEPVFGLFSAYDPYLSDESWPAGVRKAATLDDLVSQVDLISIHTPLTAETEKMFNSRTIQKMRPGSILINTSRGQVVDTAAVYQALQSGHLRGAGIDVFPLEPPQAEDPLRTHPNAICSPHAAFYSIESALEMRRKSVENIIHWAATGQPVTPVVQGN